MQDLFVIRVLMLLLPLLSDRLSRGWGEVLTAVVSPISRAIPY
jgi:hypothetical protein